MNESILFEVLRPSHGRGELPAELLASVAVCVWVYVCVLIKVSVSQV